MKISTNVSLPATQPVKFVITLRVHTIVFVRADTDKEVVMIKLAVVRLLMLEYTLIEDT